MAAVVERAFDVTTADFASQSRHLVHVYMACVLQRVVCLLLAAVALESAAPDVERHLRHRLHILRVLLHVHQ